MDISELYQIYQKHPVITTDSRDCPEGSIFLALKGASFDGNKFAAMALEKGCAYAIVDEKEYAQEGNERFILVEDCLTTFKELAREHRRHFNIPVWESREPMVRPRPRNWFLPCSVRNTT